MKPQYLKSTWRLGLRMGAVGVVLITCVYGCDFQADGTGNGSGDSLVLSMREISDDELTLIAPEDATIECDTTRNDGALARWLSSATAESTCGAVTLVNDFSGLSRDCGLTGSAMVTWIAEDECGNEATHTAVFVIVDTTPPEIGGPEDVTVPCEGMGTADALQRWLDSASAGDGCGETTLSADPVRLAEDCGEIGTTRVTWTATDDCGNVSTHTATFTVEAATPSPVLTIPDDVVVECDGESNEGEFDRWVGVARAEGGCGGISLTHEITRTADQCGGTFTSQVTWTATDACGITVTRSALFTVVDSIVPTITVPEDRLDFCEGQTDLGDLRVWLAGAVASDECGEAAVQHDFSRETVSEACDALVTWTATDECGNSVSDTAVAAVQDVEPPGITLEGSSAMILECNVDSYVEPGAAVVDACDTGLTRAEIGGNIVDTSEPGLYIVSYHATDLCGNTGAPVTRDVEVVDTLPPSAVEGIAVELWPPNHDYWNLSLADCVRDLCEIDLDINAVGQILSIYSDEPENAHGDGNTLDDILILSNSEFMLRAERQGGSNGRVYGIVFEISDSAGNGTTDTCLIGVPHDQSGALPIDNGSGAGYTVLP